MRIFMLSLALVASQAMAADPNWRVAFESGRAITYIDLDNVSSDSSGKTFWTKFVYKHPADEVAYQLEKKVINCSDKTVQRTFVATYRSDGSHIADFPSEAVKPIIPGSFAENYIKLLC